METAYEIVEGEVSRAFFVTKLIRSAHGTLIAFRIVTTNLAIQIATL